MQRQSIQVAARIRPPLAMVSNAAEQKVLTAISGSTVRVVGGDDFQYDLAIGEEQDQADVFESTATRIVQGCLEGYNGTIFAYGQTGSGKTYTMVGPGTLRETMRSNSAKRGLIPRAAELVFLLLHERQEKEGDAFHFEVKCTFVQLYREKLFDLLSCRGAPGNLAIRLDAHGNTFLTGAEERTLNCAGDLIDVVDEGLQNRNVGQTAMNTESSRSHAILTLTVKTMVSHAGGMVVNKHSRLNLVDLAGSERQKDSKSVGERFKEASSINSSLLMLGRVIRSLSDPDYKPGSYVAYRDSNLTFLLKDSLGGNAQTAVIVTLHPNRRFIEESISTLRFAQEVKKVKNRVVVNEDMSGENVDAWKTEIHRLDEALRSSNRRLEELESAVEERCKAAAARATDEARSQFEKLLEEKDLQLKELRIRYERSNMSFELLRRLQHTPNSDAAFEVMEDYKRRCDKQIDELRNDRHEGVSATMSQLSQKPANERADESRIQSLEMELNEERMAHQLTKARLEEATKRRSFSVEGAACASRQSSVGLKTPAELKKARRMTRFTMGSSAHNVSTRYSMFKPVVEDKDSDEDMFENHGEASVAQWEEERLRLEFDNNRLAQIGDELREELIRCERQKNEDLRDFAEKNDDLEKAVRELEAQKAALKAASESLSAANSALSKECDDLRRTYANLKRVNENQSAEIHANDGKIKALSRKVDELREALERSRAKNATISMSKENSRKLLEQDGLRILELESQLRDLEQGIASREERLKAVEVHTASERDKVDRLESEVAKLELLLLDKDSKLKDLEEAQIQHEAELSVKRDAVEGLEREIQETRGTLLAMEQRAKEKAKELDSLRAQYNALSKAALQVSGMDPEASPRRKSLFGNAIDAINSLAANYEDTQKAQMRLEEQVEELKMELERAKEECDIASQSAEKAMRGDAKYLDRISYVTVLRNENYEQKERIAQLEKEVAEAKGVVPQRGSMITRSAAAKSRKAEEKKPRNGNVNHK